MVRAGLVVGSGGTFLPADGIELAHKRALYLEEAARLTYQALALGRAAELPDCPPEFLRAIDAGIQRTA